MAALLFPIPGGSTFYAVLPFFTVVSGLLLAYAELYGSNLGYSKFASGNNKLTVPSKVGMFWMYFPSALVAGIFLAYGVGFLPELLKSCGASGVASLFESKEVADAASHTRLLLLIAAVLIHFSKRCLEVLFVHKFSGRTDVGSLIFISSSYASLAGLLLFIQVKSTGLTPPSLDLRWLGLAIFLVGLTGNGYHHWLLSQLRKDGSKGYVVPQGGLFGLFVCPHYVFEITTFVGIAVISQSPMGVAMAIFVLCYLTARTIKTKQWYMKKVDGFPEERSVLIPGVF